jgi:hypothetical protein
MSGFPDASYFKVSAFSDSTEFAFSPSSRFGISTDAAIAARQAFTLRPDASCSGP